MERLLLLGGLLWGAPAVLGRAPPATIVKGWEPGAQELAVYVCQGLYSRDPASAVYTAGNANDEWWLSATGGGNADGKFQKRTGGSSAKAGVSSGKAARRQEKIASRQPALSREDVLELEAIVEHEVLPAVHVEGGYHKPGFWDLFPVQLVYAPFALGRYVQWVLTWWWRYSFRQEEYDYDAREFLTKKATRMSKTQWAMLPVEQREELMAKALWVPENMDAVREEQRMEFARKHPEQYKRW